MNQIKIAVNEFIKTFKVVSLDEIAHLGLMNRTDTKFLLPVNLVPDLLTKMIGYYRVLEIGDRRILDYTTIYYDTEDFLFFRQHVTGKPDRIKIRYRKYESTGTTFLEVKMKKRNNRTVKRRIENCPGNNGFDANATDFLIKHLVFDPNILKKVLTCSFSRITLAGIGNPERITIDLSLNYKANSDAKTEYPWLAVAEWKRDYQNNRSPFPELLREFSLHPTAFSKYCVGIASFYDQPKKNLLKPVFLLLKKIENEYSHSVLV